MANSLSMRLQYAMDIRSLPTITATLPIDSTVFGSDSACRSEGIVRPRAAEQRDYSTISLCARCRELRRGRANRGTCRRDRAELQGCNEASWRADTAESTGTYFGTAVGMEGIGVVTRAGPLSRFGIGDVVLASVPNMFSRYLTLDPADGVVEPLTRDVHPACGEFHSVLDRTLQPGICGEAARGRDHPRARGGRRHRVSGGSRSHAISVPA